MSAKGIISCGEPISIQPRQSWSTQTFIRKAAARRSSRREASAWCPAQSLEYYNLKVVASAQEIFRVPMFVIKPFTELIASSYGETMHSHRFISHSSCGRVAL